VGGGGGGWVVGGGGGVGGGFVLGGGFLGGRGWGGTSSGGNKVVRGGARGRLYGRVGLTVKNTEGKSKVAATRNRLRNSPNMGCWAAFRTKKNEKKNAEDGS